ncbi:MAG: PQQ-binding-like beta-propeller repeat protein [Gemmataceae bacterium]|nr:PQQ-binding-like beta-propeller repeat protein [Gemmataceae bacterium]
MKALLTAIVAVALAAATAWSQPEPVRIYTNPRAPSREVLERLDLSLVWQTRLKTDRARDGLFSIQFMPGPTGMRLLVQTLRGEVIQLDAENGDSIWQAQVGSPYWPPRQLAFNSEQIFVTRRELMFVLGRETGKHLLWSIEKDLGRPIWGMNLEGIPVAGLAADEDSVYVPFDSRVSGYYVPEFRKIYLLQLREQTEEAIRRQPSPQLRRDWTELLEPQRLQQAPLVMGDFLGLIATDGTFLTMNKYEGTETGRFQVEKKVLAQAAQYHHMAYVASEDSQLYAFDTARGKLAWRFPGTAPILLPVHANDRDVYLSPYKVGLYRIDRIQGTARWLNREAERFLATNYKFLYALDRRGSLLVIDYDRGTTLASYGSTRDWTVIVPNELTDRIYLAAHDGSLLCLRHRDNPTPLRMKSPPEEVKVKPKKNGDKKGGPKVDDKKGPGMKGAALGPKDGQVRVASALPLRLPSPLEGEGLGVRGISLWPLAASRPPPTPLPQGARGERPPPALFVPEGLP